MVNEAQNIGTTNSDQETDWRVLRTLDAEIAERVMGWTRYSKTVHPTDNRTIGGVLYCPPNFPDSNFGGLNSIPYYSTQIADAMAVEDRIAEIGRTAEYMEALIPIVSRAASDRRKVFNYFFVAHATAEQRCRAALECAGGSK